MFPCSVRHWLYAVDRITTSILTKKKIKIQLCIRKCHIQQYSHMYFPLQFVFAYM